MDKGIRPAARNKFVELNELRRRNLEPFTGPKANTVFRRAVTDFLQNEFGCTLAAAATHYQEAFKHVKGLNAELVDGLGRPEDKNNGGRKPKVAAKPAPLLLLTYTPRPAADLDPMLPEQTVFKVCKKSDGTVVAEDMSFEDARALCEKAKAAKKAALYWV